MGKIVKGVLLGETLYLLKPPHLGGGAACERAPEGAGAPALDPEPAQIDWSALHARAAALVDMASADAQALISQAQQHAHELVSGARAHAAQIEEEHRSAGYERGVADGRNAAQLDMEDMLSTMRGLIEMALVERHKIVEGAQAEIVRLATVIAERIVHQRVEADDQVVIEMTRAAIARLVNRETVTVRVNPADIETMRENRERIMSMNDVDHLRLIEDQRVDRGGVVLETESGTIDSKISTQLREVRRLLAVDERIALGPSNDEALLSPPAQAS